MDIEKIMEQAQVFASAWSSVGGPFDSGDMLDIAEHEREVLRQMLASQPRPIVADSAPDWRELLRRCYVELFHCNQQMTSHRDENDEAVWFEGSTVRDILRDAKAALESHPASAAAVADSAGEAGDGCTEENCSRCRTAPALRTPEMRHAGIGSYPAASSAEPTAIGTTAVTEEMVRRFLGWRLPDDFSPDCGVSFTPVRQYTGELVVWPVGTNLLSGLQARQMLEYVLAAQPPAAAEAETPDMLWAYDDPESGPASTAEDFAENFASQGMMAGDESIVRVQCAKSLPDRKMLIRVSKDPEAKEWLHWEWIDAAMERAGKEGA